MDTRKQLHEHIGQALYESAQRIINANPHPRISGDQLKSSA